MNTQYIFKYLRRDTLIAIVTGLIAAALRVGGRSMSDELNNSFSPLFYQ